MREKGMLIRLAICSSAHSLAARIVLQTLTEETSLSLSGIRGRSQSIKKTSLVTCEDVSGHEILMSKNAGWLVTGGSMSSDLTVNHIDNAHELEEEKEVDCPSQGEVFGLGLVVAIIRRQKDINMFLLYHSQIKKTL